jgi:nuclear pore complex protein Nup98-Nup96
VTTESIAASSQAAVIAASLVPPKKPTVPVSHYKVTPRSISKMRLRGFGSPSSSSGSHDSSGGVDITPRKQAETSALGLDPRFQPRRSVKKLVIQDSSMSSARSGSPIASSSMRRNQSVTFDPALEDQASLMAGDVDEYEKTPSKAPLQSRKSPLANAFVATPQKSPGNKSSTPGSRNRSPAKASDYETSPSMDELLNMTDEELRAVSGFVVSLPDVGVIHFLEPVDLLSASTTKTRRGIPQILGTVIGI